VYYHCRPGLLRADAFREHGLSPEEKTTLLVFGHVLFPQDKEGYGSFCIARRKLPFIFEESPHYTHPDW
jgi:hypothetical protein